MNRTDQIRDALEKAFDPKVLEVDNQSHRHSGHAGDDGSGESHFHVRIVADAFKGMPRLARQKAVYAALGRGLMSEIHALSMEVSEG